jgi:hypothetical protein
MENNKQMKLYSPVCLVNNKLMQLDFMGVWQITDKWSCITLGVWKITNKWCCIPHGVWTITNKWSCIPWVYGK